MRRYIAICRTADNHSYYMIAEAKNKAALINYLRNNHYSIYTIISIASLEKLLKCKTYTDVYSVMKGITKLSRRDITTTFVYENLEDMVEQYYETKEVTTCLVKDKQ